MVHPLGTVLVTGGTGYVGTEVIKQFLEKGYNVRTTVRPGTCSTAVEPLHKLAAVLPGSLQVVEADLLAERPFHEAVRGARAVVHVASPFYITSSDPERELVDTAVRGTAAVFDAVQSQAAASGQPPPRVVLTSSCAAVKGMHPLPPVAGDRYSDADWNTTSTVENGEAYWVGKTRAEQHAWERSKSAGIELVTILPEFIMGPLVSRAQARGTSAAAMLGWLHGEAAPGSFTFADVRAVARAHVRAVEVPAAAGRRFIVAADRACSGADISAILKAAFPELPIRDGEEEDPPGTGVDSQPASELLGVVSPTVEESLIDMAATLIGLGLLEQSA